jgi:hypothetical protein
MLKVGSIKRRKNGKDWDIQKEFYGQGDIFKDEEAFLSRPDDPCYVPELTDRVYTRNDILKICKGNEELATDLFNELDWQHPESLLEDWEVNGEWNWCKRDNEYNPYNYCCDCMYFEDEHCSWKGEEE